MGFCNCIVTRGGVYGDLPRAQAIFHRIPRLKSQFSHSLLTYIFSYWLRELAKFSRNGFVGWQYKKIFALLRTSVTPFTFNRQYSLSGRLYCYSLFSVFHHLVVENAWYRTIVKNIIWISTFLRAKWRRLSMRNVSRINPGKVMGSPEYNILVSK